MLTFRYHGELYRLVDRSDAARSAPPVPWSTLLAELAWDPFERGALRALGARLLGVLEVQNDEWIAPLARALEWEGWGVARRTHVELLLPVAQASEEASAVESFVPTPDPAPSSQAQQQTHTVEVLLYDAFGRPFETDVVVITADGVRHEGRTSDVEFIAVSSVPGEAKISFPSLRKEDWPEPPAPEVDA